MTLILVSSERSPIEMGVASRAVVTISTIPLPGRGYWAAAKSGQIAPQPKLSGIKPGQSDLVHFRVLKKSLNLVINTDADQIIVAKAGPHLSGGLPPISYMAGGLESVTIRK